ncbi:MAG: hypothetical protein WA804_11095, partial [Terriglobales bacterium]
MFGPSKFLHMSPKRCVPIWESESHVVKNKLPKIGGEVAQRLHDTVESISKRPASRLFAVLLLTAGLRDSKPEGDSVCRSRVFPFSHFCWS